MATLLAGGVAVPLHASLAPDTLRFTLEDSAASLVILDDEHLLQTTLILYNQLPELQTILILNTPSGSHSYPHLISITDILAETSPLTSEEEEAIRVQATSTAPETLAFIHYTAGETGRLKGAVFDHARALKTIQYMARWLFLEEDDLAFTILPWSHTASLKAALHYFISGVANVLSEGRKTAVAENMRLTSPTVTLNMPYFFERFYDHVMNDVAKMPEASQAVFQWAIAKGKEYHMAGPAATPELRQEYNRADMTFFNRIRGSIGGRFRRLYSAGAPLPKHLIDFFEAIGLPALSIYSLTESGGFPAVTQLETRRSGSCGQTAPGFEIQIAEDGELLIRGETVMSEYWGWPAEIQQVLDSEGWLHTGDLGYLDRDGYLYLTGRKQPTVMLSTAHKFMPSTIEKTLTANPFIAQAIVFGEGRPYVSALIIPNLEALSAHFQEYDQTDEEVTSPTISEATTLQWLWPREASDCEPMMTTAHPRVKGLLDELLEKINKQLDRREQIKAYILLDQAGSKTANEMAELILSGHRHLIAEQYASQIETMYPPAPRVEEKAVTEVQVDPERMRELLEKENILDAWLTDAGIEFLFRLANIKHIDRPAMVHICDAVATIAQTESEEKPLSTAIIVGDPVRIARVLPPSQVQLLRYDHIRRMRGILVTLAKLVDGLVLGYIVDNHGYVRGIHKLNIKLEKKPTSPLLGPQFRHHATISKLCDAVVFFAPVGGKQVRVFADGQLVGRYSNGDWSPENMSHIDETITQLTRQKNYNPGLVQRILSCAFQMSEENLGAIFIIGHAETILKYSDAPEISHFALIISDQVKQMTNKEIINFAKQDGATVIDAQGKFSGCMVLLRPNANTQAEIGPGKGARHSSAAKMSAEAQCLAITVSQDGPITIYESGRRILSI